MNKVILMGRLTREPVIRYSAGESSTAIARYTLAVDRRTGKATHPQPAPADAGDGFMSIPEGMDEDLPFC